MLIEDAWQKGLKAFGSDQQHEKLNKLLHDITAADDNGIGLEKLKVRMCWLMRFGVFEIVWNTF